MGGKVHVLAPEALFDRVEDVVLAWLVGVHVVPVNLGEVEVANCDTVLLRGREEVV